MHTTASFTKAQRYVNAGYSIERNCEKLSEDCGQECQCLGPKSTRKFVRALQRIFSMAQLPYSNLSPPKAKRNIALYGLLRRILSVALTVSFLFAIYRTWIWGETLRNRTTIIVVTPTHRRPERFADMTRFSQTLMHVKDLHWIVIEDANQTEPAVERILQRSRIPYTYFYATTAPGFPKRGWTHRNMGLEYIRKHYRDYTYNAVVYFADDDNSYDVRLFDDYIRRVSTIGVWAVGMAGGAVVEAPHVENGVITKWDVIYAPSRKYATDMAGFAVNLNLVLKSSASFHIGCVKVSPESCFLQQFNVPANKAEPFGWNSNPKEVLVWHTKTRNIGVKGDNHGYVVER